jgi:hypothetical protein
VDQRIISQHSTEEERAEDQLTKFLKKYEDVFVAHEFDPEKNSIVYHAIPLEGPTPIKLLPFVPFDNKIITIHVTLRKKNKST